MKKKNPFSSMQNAAVGMAGLGITTDVVSGIDAMAPAGTPKMGAAMNTMASFTSVVGTMVGAKTVLNMMPKRKRRGMY
jgi:hypothetical protein